MSPPLSTLDIWDVLCNIVIAVSILIAARTVWELDYRWYPVRALFGWMLAALACRWIGDSIFFLGFFGEQNRHIWRMGTVQPTLLAGIIIFIHAMKKEKLNNPIGPRIAIVCINDQGIITHWNSASEKLLGWRENEVVGRELAVVVVPDRSRDKHRAGIESLKTDPHPWILERPFHTNTLTRNGVEIPVEIVVTRHQTPYGPTYMATIREEPPVKPQTQKNGEVGASPSLV